MNDNKRSLSRCAKAGLNPHAAIPDKTNDSVLIEEETAAFLAKGNTITEIPSNLYRSAEEVSMIAASERNSLNRPQLKAHNKRKAKFQSDTARTMHLSNREGLGDMVK